MLTGTVKWFNDAEGVGFITPDGGGEDLFAHFSEIQVQGFKTLQEQQKVSFDVRASKRQTSLHYKADAHTQWASVAGSLNVSLPAAQV